jgi:2-amino-4-hydroxy-6-hydroxymethyldihydropteridine diphosphokinase
MSASKKIYLHTGSNLGNREKNLFSACQEIEEKIGKISQQSSLYETEAWGVENQPAYFNQALEVETQLSPLEVLNTIGVIEKKLGRIRTIRWSSRIIDIDILFYGDSILNTHNLTIPHPRIPDRNFVLIPMKEIAPNLVHPVLKKDILTLLSESTDKCEVKKWEVYSRL